MIRAAHPHEIRLLPQIENAADQRFARVGLQRVVDMPGHSIAALEHGRRHGLLWVAIEPRGHVVGFALIEIKRGTALIERCAATARALGHEPLYLTTYRDVAWNKPFYQRRGFTEVPRGALDRTLRGVLLLEVRHGHPVWRRAVMTR
ncbi:hypothetical protein [Reyranella sp.]|uniref:hypothetical protein n=1 Tax=Reyranella sp. TaxID=1929291 RepID=UPI003D0EB496